MALLSKLREISARLAPIPADGSSDTDPPSLNIWLEVFLFSLLVILVFHIYAHSREGPFVFDDLVNILDNPDIRITTLDWDSIRRAAFESPIPTRAVANISFALNYYFHQYAPEGYRLVNVIIHLCNGFLLYFFLKLTLQTPHLINRYRTFALFIPFAAVSIWLVNPLHTQSVSYIVQRMNSMATMFYLLAFLCYVRARLLNRGSRYRWLLIGSGILAFLLALGSKENAITLPFFIFLYEWYFFRDLSRRWLKKNYLWLAAILLFYVCIAFLYVGDDPLTRILYDYQARDFTMPQRILTQFRVVIFYIFLFIFPHPSRLNLDHHFPLSLSLIDPPTTLLSIFAVCGLLAAATIMARRERLLSFCIFWFFGNLVLESSIIGLEIVFEHRTYLPAILMSIVLVVTVCRLIKNKWIRGMIFCILVATGTIWTHDRNLVWSNDLALWEDTMKKSPEKVRPYVNLGIAYNDRGQFEQAVRYLSKAVHLNPDYPKALYNLSIALLAKGDYRQAEEHAISVLGYTPNDTDTINALGIAMAQQGRLDEAINNFLQALQLNPHAAETHYNLALSLDNAGQTTKAINHYSEALRIKPDYRAARLHLKQIRRRIKLHKPLTDKPFSKAIVRSR